MSYLSYRIGWVSFYVSQESKTLIKNSIIIPFWIPVFPFTLLFKFDLPNYACISGWKFWATFLSRFCMVCTWTHILHKWSISHTEDMSNFTFRKFMTSNLWVYSSSALNESLFYSQNVQTCFDAIAYCLIIFGRCVMFSYIWEIWSTLCIFMVFYLTYSTKLLFDNADCHFLKLHGLIDDRHLYCII